LSNNHQTFIQTYGSMQLPCAPAKRQSMVLFSVLLFHAIDKNAFVNETL